jgi:DNA-directed RNA polymerase
MVVLAAAAEGIEMVSVHDCFGCLAPHAKRLNEIIREKFVEVHEYDWLGSLRERARRDGVKLPPPPEKGDLDLKGVLQSEHAFK